MEKPKKGEKMKLHQWIARGGKPEDYEGATENAVEEAKEKKSEEK